MGIDCSKCGHEMEYDIENAESDWYCIVCKQEKEIDQLKEQLDYYSNKINVQNYVALTKENTQLKARIAELENILKDFLTTSCSQTWIEEMKATISDVLDKEQPK